MKRVIYGAGKNGIRLWKHFETLGVNIDYFVQTNIIENRILDGIRIISLNELAQINDDILICLAIKNRKIVNEIISCIQNMKDIFVGKVIIYDYGSYIEENYTIRVPKRNTSDQLCIICGNENNRFTSAGTENGFFSKHHVIGGGYRTNCICPCCESSDRERWFFYVMKYYLNIEKSHGRILHFAPEKSLLNMLIDSEVDYYPADIIQGRGIHKVDITNIKQFSDNTFDYVICNHVMEHIIDEKRAVYEIKRVLKDTGKWIFSFPICTELDTTYENMTITDPEERLRVYGQKDHVRLYGMDYKERFEGYGLEISEYIPIKYFDKQEIEYYGFIEDDRILVATFKQ